jgi:cell division protein FtsL
MNTTPKKGHFLKMLTLVMLSLVLLLLFGHGFFGKKGYLAVRRMKQQNQDLNQKIEQLKKENGQAMEEIKALKSDPKAIEKIAREELGLVKPGEVKITTGKLKPESSSAPPPSQPAKELP